VPVNWDLSEDDEVEHFWDRVNEYWMEPEIVVITDEQLAALFPDRLNVESTYNPETDRITCGWLEAGVFYNQ
jgi:hypothetical protein